MKNIKKQITLFLTLIVFVSSFVFSFSLDKIYASGYDTVNELQVSAVKSSTSKSSSSSKPKSSSYKKSKITTIKPSSGSFSTNSSSSYKSSSSSSTNKSSSTKKNNTSTNKTTIKPDSGSFTTKPNTNYSTNSGSSYGSSSSSSSVKPDSGSFSTKPNTNNKKEETKKENNTNSDYDSGKTYRPYGSWGRRTYIPMYGRGLFGYNPFRGFGYRMGISSMIMDIVMVITILIVAYIIFDMIRSRRNRK